jgi:hypothetical protein
METSMKIYNNLERILTDMSTPYLDVDTTFDFTCRFKIVDINGYKLHLHKIFKRSLSKKNLELLENLIQEKFPLTNERLSSDCITISLNEKK